MSLFKKNGYWGDKWALQLGAKYVDILPNLDAQVEFNYVRPFTYTHSDGSDSYTNYNQPLADPLGADFYELIFNLHLHPTAKLSFNAKYMLAQVSGDTLINNIMSNYGGNIFQPSNPSGSLLITPIPGYTDNAFGHKLGQGVKSFINYFEFAATYQIWHNINFDATILYRSQSSLTSPNNPLQGQSTFVFTVGARVNIARRTYLF